MKAIKVLILLGSESDRPLMEKAGAVLDDFGVSCKTLIRSAHRAPDATIQAVRNAEAAGCQVFVCAAGMAAHLAGMVAAHTIRPVIGVPVSAGPLQGKDALFSTVMMPPGVPVATVAINGAKNAALLAVQILARSDAALARKLEDARAAQAMPRNEPE